jgi:hypothetical protein
MVVIGVIMIALAVVVTSMWIESRCGRRRWRWRRNRLLVPVRWVVPTGMNWVIVAERYTFEFAWRSADGLGLAKRNVMRGFAFENEICRLVGRE